MISVVFLVLLIAVASAQKCWLGLPRDEVWVNTVGPARVQMGYLSASFMVNGTPTVSGQQIITAERCRSACDAMGPKLCAAVQFFKCEDLSINWCNLLTPTEFANSETNTVVIDSATTGVYGYAFKRAKCGTTNAIEGGVLADEWAAEEQSSLRGTV
ncbi:MAG: hypothetical protein EOP48_18050 [Sphingobacteriales bacterium]|nr:MAG: hypothetical protein EOP48_18050 [Sphingobacteriales bacterium]